MKRPDKLLSMIAAAAMWAAAAAPAAMAGNEIVKCVDAAGHVTLTDQPCDSGATTVRLSSDTPQAQQELQPAQQTQSQTQTQPQQRHLIAAAELRHAGWKQPPAVRAAPLSRDVATLKAAHRMMLLQETRPRLAGLN
ncbi:MAG: DUF4124 domain-containing protein [Telluria sp.]